MKAHTCSSSQKWREQKIVSDGHKIDIINILSCLLDQMHNCAVYHCEIIRESFHLGLMIFKSYLLRSMSRMTRYPAQPLPSTTSFFFLCCFSSCEGAVLICLLQSPPSADRPAPPPKLSVRTERGSGFCLPLTKCLHATQGYPAAGDSRVN